MRWGLPVCHFTNWLLWPSSTATKRSGRGQKLSCHSSHWPFRRKRRREWRALMKKLGWGSPKLRRVCSNKVSAHFNLGQLAVHSRLIDAGVPFLNGALWTSLIFISPQSLGTPPGEATAVSHLTTRRPPATYPRLLLMCILLLRLSKASPSSPFMTGF